jgi:hypothetical protein
MRDYDGKRGKRAPHLREQQKKKDTPMCRKHNKWAADLALDGDGAVVDGVHAQDGRLRRVQDGRAHQ